MTKSRDLADNSQNTKPKVVDAKGDLIVGTGADAADRLAVGANGYTIVADSSTSTGLAYSPTFFAGKNKVINGDFGVWQRGTSITATNGAYTVDRFIQYYDGSGSTRTVSQQTFTPGAAPVAGYEGQFFARYATTVAGTSGTFHSFGTRIEDVRTFANQTVTFSFWAKADATRTISPFMQQAFGSGGSGATTTYASSTVTLTTSWQRFAVNFTFPSVSGKTIGSGSSIYLALDLPSNTAMTLDFWGWQLEAGSTATQFQTATGTIQGELTACQRYYEKSYNQDVAPATNTAAGLINAMGTSNGGADVAYFISFKVNKRANPTFTFYKEGGASGSWEYQRSGVGTTGSAASAFSIGTTGGSVSVDVGANWTNAWIFGHWVAEAEL